jgi:hypothetical protein
MTLDLTDEEAALLLKELNRLVDGDRYFLSDRTRTLEAIRAKIRPERSRSLCHRPKALRPAAGVCGNEATREPLTNQARQAYN